MDGSEFINLAQMMAARSGTPAWHRTASSRAYYGAFHIARVFLEQMGVRPVKDEHSHKFIHTCLENSKTNQSTEAGQMLGDLHIRRKEADYKLFTGAWETPGFARDSVELATAIHALLIECGDEPLRSAVQTGALAYQALLRGQ